MLSKKDAKLFEDVIVQYGRIVSFAQLQEIFKREYSTKNVKKRVSLLCKLGWLVRIKRGLYIVVTDIGNLSSSDVSLLTITRTLNNDSYVSFENALQRHGMFDQMLSGVGAVTFKRARTYEVQGGVIKFFSIKKELYFGFSEERSDVGSVNIAHKEKALLDILYYRSNAYYASLVWEKIREYKERIDLSLLTRYALKFDLNVVRHIGFFLDLLDADTSDLAEKTRGKTSYSRMSKGAKKFNSKWRLYFDDTVIK